MNTITRTPYSYSILRYVHDIGSGEFINVGVVMSAPRAPYVGAKFKMAYSRVKAAFPSVDSKVYRSRMRRLQAAFDKISSGDLGTSSSIEGIEIKTLITSVIRDDDSSLQWSSLGSGLSTDLPKTLNSLYQRFVTKYDSELTSHFRKDEDVWRSFKTELERRNVLSHLEQKTIAVEDDSVKFEHAWKNGAWHCYEPLSFDLSSDSSIKEKAHRWLGQMSSLKESHEAFNVYFLVGKPTDSALSGAYEQAISILSKAPSSEVVEEDKVDTFSALVAEAISAHQLKQI